MISRSTWIHDSGSNNRTRKSFFVQGLPHDIQFWLTVLSHEILHNTFDALYFLFKWQTYLCLRTDKLRTDLYLPIPTQEESDAF